VLKRPFFWVGAAVSAGALALAARGLRFGEVADALGGANYLWLIPALAALLAGFYLRAFRWEVLFHPVAGLSRGNLFGAISVGYMLNNLLPLRLGEVGRAYVIGEVEHVGRIHALSTILVERLLDVLVLFALLLLLLPFVDEPGWATGPALVLGLGVIALSATLIAMGRARRLVLAVADRVLRAARPSLADRLLVWVEAALDGFAALGHPRVFFHASMWSVVGWGFSSLYLYVVLLAFDLPLTYAAPLFVMVALNLGMVVPSSSGYIGVYHAIAIETLTGVFGVDRDAAAGFALVSHAMFYVTPIVLGLSFLWSRRTLWDQIFSGSFRVSAAKAP